MAREVRENSKATKQKKFVVVYEGYLTHIAEVVGGDAGMSFREAKKEAMSYLETQREYWTIGLKHCRGTVRGNWDEN